MLMMLLSTLFAIKCLKCGISQSWLLNLNLTCKTLQTGAGCGLLISMLEKLSFDRSYNSGPIEVKMEGFVFE